MGIMGFCAVMAGLDAIQTKLDPPEVSAPNKQCLYGEFLVLLGYGALFSAFGLYGVHNDLVARYLAVSVVLIEAFINKYVTISEPPNYALVENQA